jgi:hypothetical protein
MMRTLGGAKLLVMAVVCALLGCAGSGGGNAPKKPACKAPAPADQTVSFSANIQPIFNRSCAFAGCHVAASANAGLDLSQGAAYDQIVRVPSTQQRKLKRVLPGNPDDSYLVQKMEDAPTITGDVMPVGCPGSQQAGVLCPVADDFAAIRQWIVECATDN